MPQIEIKEAQRLAIEKAGPEAFVGNLDEVWQEARRRAQSLGYPSPGQINCERLDGAWWDDDNDQYQGARDPLTDHNNRYWFILLPKQPWDEAEDRAQKYVAQIKAWDPEAKELRESLAELWPKYNINGLVLAIRRLKDAIDRVTHCTGQEHKLEDYIDITNLPVAAAYRDLVENKSEYPIWACDGNGYCLVGADLTEVKHIAEIYDIGWIKETGKWPSADKIRAQVQEEEDDPAGMARDEGPI